MLPWSRFLLKRRPLQAGPSRLIFSLSSPQKVINGSNYSLELARAIRRAIEAGEVDRGYQFFTTTCSRSPSIPDARYKQTRFLAHVLIHALHRCRKPLTAASFTKLCLERRIDISKRTFDTTFSGILPHITSKLSEPPPGISKPPSRSQSMTAALSLLSAARKSGHEHSSWMYDRIINAILLQGEVLTATFLFIALVREWNYRRQSKIPERDEEIETSSEISRSEGNFPKMAARPNQFDLQMKRFLNGWMNSITSELHNRTRLSDSSDSSEVIPRTQVFRGLDALIGLLSEDKLDIPNRWRLLRVMYLIPYESFSDASVYHRWHAILLDYCQGHRGGHELDLPSYHVLLHYAFLYRRSVELGITVLRRLCQKHHPSPVTYNILLHGFSSIRDQDNFAAISALIATRGRQLLDPLRHFDRRDENKVRYEIIQSLQRHPIPRPDEYTITTHMLNAIALGKHHLPCGLVSRLFPTIRSLDPRKRKRAGRVNLQRAGRLSPHFWSIAVHAASKAENLPFTMAIWWLVVKAENLGRKQQSFHSIYSREAYTSHIHLFSRVANIIQKRMKRSVNSGGQRNLTHIRRAVKLFRVILQMVDHVLTRLRDRLVQDTPPLDYSLDTLLIESMVVLVDNLVNVQRYIYIIGNEIIHQILAPKLEFTNTRRLDVIIGIARHILRIHDIPVPNDWQEYRDHLDIQDSSGWLGKPLHRKHLVSTQSVGRDSKMALSWEWGPAQAAPFILKKTVESQSNTTFEYGVGSRVVASEVSRDFTFLTNLLRSK
ncbi:hypothetical protein CPB86DRAFT_871847 [Serendipita vermifera]|nr:hypothetical protein CPB86DRAFT_871847 [Serendipita vermifera]